MGIFSTEGEENVSLGSHSLDSLSPLGPVLIIAGLVHVYVQDLCPFVVCFLSYVRPLVLVRSTAL